MDSTYLLSLGMQLIKERGDETIVFSMGQGGMARMEVEAGVSRAWGRMHLALPVQQTATTFSTLLAPEPKIPHKTAVLQAQRILGNAHQKIACFPYN